MRTMLNSLVVKSVASVLMFVATAAAHDTWVQSNTNVIRAGDAIHIDLMLGNHGNEHRDYKLASKVALDGCSLRLTAPSGKTYDLKDRLVDTGYTPKEGFWTTRFAASEPGLYLVEHSVDQVVNHGKPVRSLKSAKTFFVVSKSLDKVSQENPGFDRVLGHALEIVPMTNPVTPMGPGQKLTVKLLLKGKPLADAQVSFIPRSETLTEDFDDRYERKTDANGLASFTPKTGDYYLVVAHHKAADEKADGYDSTAYSATLTVFVPEVCPCCGE
jgi:uncharacterized GH25 family protein